MINETSSSDLITKKSTKTLVKKIPILSFQSELKKFIEEADASVRGIKPSTWFKFGNTEVCLRVSKRRIYDGTELTRLLDIATINTPLAYQRKQRFAQLLYVVREVTDMPLYIENAFPAFADALQGIKYGFSLVSTDGYSSCLMRNEIQETTDMKRISVK
jgi:hypothetical protein